MIVNGIDIDIVRKNIKNIHLGVYPPEGKVRVAAPNNTTDDKIRLLVVSRLKWIKRQQEKFLNQERQSKREYVSGESHYLWGDRYILRVIERDNRNSKVEIENKRYINLYVYKGTPVEKIEEILNKWYRNQIKEVIPRLLDKWQPIIDVEVKEWGIRKMQTKWGTCNREASRIWFNLYLAKRPQRCLEYVMVHELIHLIERNHNEKFKELMDTYYPNWRTVRDELNSFILEHFQAD